MLGTAFAGKEDLVEQLTTEVREVEKILRDSLCSEVDTVEKVGLHTLDSGGKRLRPALVVTSARAVCEDFSINRARELGACLEMIHMATLIHDDVIDRAATRRGVPTAASVYGNVAAILSGDVLLAKAMALLAKDGDLAIIRGVSSAVVSLAEGEVAELETRCDSTLTQEKHYNILIRKTASLISCCCEVGGRVANANPEQLNALMTYGHHLGLAFQLVDDLLDYKGNPLDTGKPRATDFVEGCLTMPLILLLEKLESPKRALLAESLGKESRKELLDDITAKMDEFGVFEQVQVLIKEEHAKAVEALQSLPKTPHRDLLETVASFVVQRDR